MKVHRCLEKRLDENTHESKQVVKVWTRESTSSRDAVSQLCYSTEYTTKAEGDQCCIKPCQSCIKPLQDISLAVSSKGVTSAASCFTPDHLDTCVIKYPTARN